jgi:hypothetical protein
MASGDGQSIARMNVLVEFALGIPVLCCKHNPASEAKVYED